MVQTSQVYNQDQSLWIKHLGGPWDPSSLVGWPAHPTSPRILQLFSLSGPQSCANPEVDANPCSRLGHSSKQTQGADCGAVNPTPSSCARDTDSFKAPKCQIPFFFFFFCSLCGTWLSLHLELSGSSPEWTTGLQGGWFYKKENSPRFGIQCLALQKSHRKLS